MQLQLYGISYMLIICSTSENNQYVATGFEYFFNGISTFEISMLHCITEPWSLNYKCSLEQPESVLNIVGCTRNQQATLVVINELINDICDKLVIQNIRQSFKGCRQTFEDYKLIFIDVLIVASYSSQKAITVINLLVNIHCSNTRARFASCSISGCYQKPNHVKT